MHPPPPASFHLSHYGPRHHLHDPFPVSVEQGDAGFWHWVEILLQGGLATMLAFVGAWIIFRKTVENDRQLAHNQTKELDRQAKAARRAESVAILVSGTSKAGLIVGDASRSTPARTQAVNDLLDNMFAFVGRELADHPNVALWVMDNTRNLAGFDGVNGSERSPDIVRLIADVGGAVLRWQAQGKSDDEFVHADEVAEYKKTLLAEPS